MRCFVALALFLTLPVFGQALAPIRMPERLPIPAHTSRPVHQDEDLPRFSGLGGNTSGDDDDWRTADTVREVLGTLSLIADWGQTLDLVSNHQGVKTVQNWDTVNPDGSVTHSVQVKTKTLHEINPILGPCPSRGAVNRYFALCIGSHYLISKSLPRGWREGFQYMTIGIEAYVVPGNARFGLKMRF